MSKLIERIKLSESSAPWMVDKSLKESEPQVFTSYA